MTNLQKDEYIKEASATIYQLSQEDDIRLQCEARNDYYRGQRSIQAMVNAQQATIQYQKDTLKANEDIINNQKETIAQLSAENTILLA